MFLKRKNNGLVYKLQVKTMKINFLIS